MCCFLDLNVFCTVSSARRPVATTIACLVSVASTLARVSHSGELRVHVGFKLREARDEVRRRLSGVGAGGVGLDGERRRARC